LALLLAVPASVSAAPAPVVKPNVNAELVQDAGYEGKRRWWRRDADGQEYVRAPFTSVETGKRTNVEAPFTSVQKDRAGTWVRAPFVNLFVPR
jgi:hypothetical protein